MRFTFLLPADNLTGGARVAVVYAAELQAMGHTVLLVTCAPDRPGLREKVGVLLRRRPRRPDPQPGHVALSGLPHIVLERPGPIRSNDVPDADVIVGTWWETVQWMHRMPASKGRRVHLIQGYEVWLPGQAAEVHRTLELPNVKIAISHDLRDTLLREVGPLDIHVIANAIDPAQFDAPRRARHPRPTVGFVYSPQPIKGSDICIRAIERARREMPGLDVVAFGADEPTADLPLPEGTRWHLRPPQHVLRELYASCDAWLFGSRLDSFGLPVLEAMACRTPVVGVPVGAAPQLLSGGAGRLVPGEDPDAMADALLGLLKLSPAQWQAVSDAAHQRAHARTWSDAAREFVSRVAPGRD